MTGVQDVQILAQISAYDSFWLSRKIDTIITQASHKSKKKTLACSLTAETFHMLSQCYLCRDKNAVRASHFRICETVTITDVFKFMQTRSHGR